MADASAGGLYQCLTDISRADTSGDYQKALTSANKLIRKYPKETFAFKCKLVAQIQLSQYADALELIRKTPAHQMGHVGFEKAYIHYRQDELDEAIKELNTCDKDDVKALELKAQVFYKQENYQQAYDIYLYLLKNHSDDSDELRRANFLAVQARLEAQGVKQAVAETEDSYSQLYNRACVEIEAEKLPQALESLEKALKTCRKSFEDEDREEDEIEEELDSIRVQKAYVLQRMGQKAEALAIYEKVQAANHPDSSVKATITNNIPAASSDFALPESRKRFKAALQIDQTKLTRRQRLTLMLNNALVLLLSNQREPCKRALEELVAKFGSSKDVALIEATLHFKMGDAEAALKVLAGSDLEQSLARLHVLLNAGRLPEAVGAIRDLPISGKLGASSLLTSTLIAADSRDEAVKELVAASTAKNQTPEALKSILEDLVEVEQQRGNETAATKHLEKLVEKFPEDLQLQCRLVGAYSKTDPKKAESLSAKLFPETMEVDVNVDELEDSDWILYGEKYRQKKEAKSPQTAEIAATRKLKIATKRKRKIRLPKNYNSAVTPDPERWLPRQERSTYKRKRKNREREIGRGTQGSSSANPNVEYVTASPNSPRPLPGPVAEGPRQQRPNFQKQKKKKNASKF
ncbi:Signal recognition particle subunit SRP72 [Caenorhabditis elegans]|uniref:Signal recognition particle subunit SRP72 n=1 Tax=Caenorhabditis elegans TaxID=6239 RepID=SRP72_CAEEL|nr:Signal recognition particle subunit SRP72 [Caenorhabditis elegans]P91240.2 RecName: Full=Signal recognition particle subunit SRP72; Short=SRP72; AltName: Full=Signal recognition particle 72 kDa protein homolog [Caenorhabditis elegans]CCD69012.1 Signal recognition particle subunit SRP72 [Caenorhabditis elegans]|eukprot:NP_494366.2 Signal recognition particle subunit SRP72 [Caenorhabditis elegans]